MAWTDLSTLVTQLNSSQLPFWGSLASIASLGLMWLNTRRIARISRFIDWDHDRIDDTIKPFDIYSCLYSAMDLLERSQDRFIFCEADRIRLRLVLKQLESSSDCLRGYFKEIYGLKTAKSNIYLDAGKIFELRENTQTALGYYEKAFHQAAENDNFLEEKECLVGMYFCYALLRDSPSMKRVEEIATALKIDLQPVTRAEEIARYLKVDLQPLKFDLQDWLRHRITMLSANVKTAVHRLARRRALSRHIKNL